MLGRGGYPVKRDGVCRGLSKCQSGLSCAYSRISVHFRALARPNLAPYYMVLPLEVGLSSSRAGQ